MKSTMVGLSMDPFEGRGVVFHLGLKMKKI